MRSAIRRFGKATPAKWLSESPEALQRMVVMRFYHFEMLNSESVFPVISFVMVTVKGAVKDKSAPFSENQLKIHRFPSAVPKPPPSEESREIPFASLSVSPICGSGWLENVSTVVRARYGCVLAFPWSCIQPSSWANPIRIKRLQSRRLTSKCLFVIGTPDWKYICSGPGPTRRLQ